MKKISQMLGMALMAALLMVGTPAEAQTRQQKKDAKKAAKILEKEGYQTMDIPIVRQLEQFYAKRDQIGEDGMPAYLHASGIGVGNTYAAARLLATTDAKVRLAGNIQTKVMDEVKARVADDQLSSEEAVSVTRALEKATLLVAEKLNRAITAQEYFKVLPNKNYEVRVTLMYSVKTIEDMLLKEARKALEEEMKNYKPEHEKFLEGSICGGLKGME